MASSPLFRMENDMFKLILLALLAAMPLSLFADQNQGIALEWQMWASMEMGRTC